MKKYVAVLLITGILLATTAYYELLIARTATDTVSSRQNVPNAPVVETPVETSKTSGSSELFDDWDHLSRHVNESIVVEGNLSGPYVWLDVYPTPCWNYWLCYDEPFRVGVLGNYTGTEYNSTHVRVYGTITERVWGHIMNYTNSWHFITAERIEVLAN